MGLFSIARQALRFVGRNAKYGKLIGKSNNGIKVYQRAGKDGTKVLTSLKEGKVYKEITKKNINKSNIYERVTGHTTTVKNYPANETIQLENTNTIVTRDTNWLDRYFHRGQTVNKRSVSKHNGNNLVDSRTNYSIPKDNSWSYSVHQRPNITKVTVKNELDKDFRSVKNYFELNGFKFPGGAVHNGRIGYQKGVSPLDGEYLRKFNVNPYGDDIKIKYKSV